MAKEPKQTLGSKLLNIMGLQRGNFEFDKPDAKVQTVPQEGSRFISDEMRSKILSGAFRAVEPQRQAINQASLMQMVQSSYSKVGGERAENRKILQLVPEVKKAARLMTASIFSPNDLSASELTISFDAQDIPEPYISKLNKTATEFFDKKLNLKTAAPKWVFEAGYEAGASVFAIIPLQSFAKIQDSSYIGNEAYSAQVIDSLAQESLFGFSDGTLADNSTAGLESLAGVALETMAQAKAAEDSEDRRKPKRKSTAECSEAVKKLVSQIVGTEALSISDNPSVLQASDIAKKKREERNKKILDERFRGSSYRRPTEQGIVSVSKEKPQDDPVVGNPILFRLPPESVTVIHTPGDPSDHQGYFILLDRLGNPVNAMTDYENDLGGNTIKYATNQANIFDQVYQAYGLGSGMRGQSNEETMRMIYTKIVTEHLQKRADKAGYANIAIANNDSVFRCMFARFMEQKHTRILFMPKELVSYMAFELDQNGYGISRLDYAKFNIAMKMAVKVSRTMAATKAAMDKRLITVNVTDQFFENPETLVQNIMREYVNKNTITFNVDPNMVQGQIVDKSVSMKITGIPGLSNLDITNDPDTRTGSFDFDPSITEDDDKSIMNAMHVPAATMNSLNEDEYARSVVTTNLFFAMDVAMDQEIVKKIIGDLLRKYARYSEEFQNRIREIAPGIFGKHDKDDDSNVVDIDLDDDGKPDDRKDDGIPDHYTIDSLIDAMVVSLPTPSVAPSKAQFEALDAMINSIRGAVEALMPSELAGSDDTLAPALSLVRAKLITNNIRDYMERSGMRHVDIPENNFASILSDVDILQDGLANIREMMKAKAAIGEQPAAGGELEPDQSDTGGSFKGY